VTPLADVVDLVLEVTIIGSFSRIGFDVRSHLSHWTEPSSMQGRTVLITGATSGIGLTTATELSSLGAAVRFVARDEAKANEARNAIVHASDNRDVDFYLADLSDLDGVRTVCQQLLADLEVLDVLVHNAGALSSAYAVSSSGTELTVASQVVGPFLMTSLLTPLLARASPGRVITVSSGGMYSERFELDRLEMSSSDYNGVRAYARAKRAQVVLNHEWARRTERSSIVFHAMHPGWVDTPGVSASLPRFHRYARPLLRSTKQGADTTVWLAATPVAERSSGLFWLDRRPRWEHKVPWTVSRHSKDDQLQLWNWCTNKTKLA
jgi:NAD(P)-dependent dehydrogenase (short-subunit alcohol dehydrogenase family)